MDQRWPLSPARPPIRWSIDDDPDVAADAAIERRVLVAPGGRYRVLDGDDLTSVCDGQYRWDIDGNTADRGPAGLSPSAAFRGLLTPRWLIAYYDLEIGPKLVIAAGPPTRSLPRRERWNSSAGTAGTTC